MATPAPTAANSANTTSAEAAAAPRLKVLLALEATGGGAGRHVRDLAAGLLQRGHRVSLAYSQERVETGWLEAIDSLPGLKLTAVPMQRAVGQGDLVALRALRRLLASAGPFDIAHGHSSKAGALLRLAAHGAGLPCVYTPHAFITLDPELGRLRRLAYGLAERWLATRAERIICVSRQEFEHARRLGITAARLRLVANGIGPLPPAERLPARRELGLPAGAICIGSVGRLAPQKAFHCLLAAFALLESAQAPLWLAIVGDGPERPVLERQAARLGIGERVLFAGPGDGARLMAGFDLFALPSRYEAGPYVLLEAAARGLPIVMTPTGGAGEVVRHGDNGLVADDHGHEALAACLQRLLDDPAQRRRMGQRSRTIAAEYSVDRMVEATLAVYHEARAARQ